MMVFELAWCNKSYWVGPLQQVEIKLAIFCDDIALRSGNTALGGGAVAPTPNSSLLTVTNSKDGNKYENKNEKI